MGITSALMLSLYFSSALFCFHAFAQQIDVPGAVDLYERPTVPRTDLKFKSYDVGGVKRIYEVATFKNGSLIERLIGLQFSEPAPMEIIIMNDYEPFASKNPRIEKHKVHKKIQIRPRQVYMKAEEVLSGKKTLADFPSCEKGEWTGFLHGTHSPEVTQMEILEDSEKGPFLALGQALCLRF